MLTNLEKRILIYQYKNLSYKEIGKILNISRHTVKAHETLIAKKLKRLTNYTK